jgi:hypothetical protein
MPQSLLHATVPHVPQQRTRPEADQMLSAMHILHTLRGKGWDDSDKFPWHMHMRMGISRSGCLLLSAAASMVMVATDSPPADNKPPTLFDNPPPPLSTGHHPRGRCRSRRHCHCQQTNGTIVIRTCNCRDGIPPIDSILQCSGAFLFQGYFWVLFTKVACNAFCFHGVEYQRTISLEFECIKHSFLQHVMWTWPFLLGLEGSCTWLISITTALHIIEKHTSHVNSGFH